MLTYMYRSMYWFSTSRLKFLVFRFAPPSFALLIPKQVKSSLIKWIYLNLRAQKVINVLTFLLLLFGFFFRYHRDGFSCQYTDICTRTGINRSIAAIRFVRRWESAPQNSSSSNILAIIIKIVIRSFYNSKYLICTEKVMDVQMMVTGQRYRYLNKVSFC